MQPFTYESLASRIVFGVDAFSDLADEVGRLGGSRVLIVCTPGRCAMAEHATAMLGDKAVGMFDKATMHVPVDIAEAASAEAKRLKADCCVSIGGGSAVDLGKRLVISDDLVSIAVVTTYSGAEVSPFWSLTVDGAKQTARDPMVMPRTVIYDPALTTDLPMRVGGTSGINAIAHAVEALYSPAPNPVTDMIAEEGIRALASGLRKIAAAPEDLEGRGEALYGGYLCGVTLQCAQMALHHKLCHVLGGTFGLPHSEVHASILPYCVAYNRDGAPDAMARIARALGAEDAAHGLYGLKVAASANIALKDLGMQESDLETATRLGVEHTDINPSPVTFDGVRNLLERAFHGLPPG